jgi:hypothetical protein
MPGRPHHGQVHEKEHAEESRNEGNEDGRGGYGAFLYDRIMDAYLPYNTDPAHPMFVVLLRFSDNKNRAGHPNNDHQQPSGMPV